MGQSFLTVKLHELEQQQGKLQTGIRISQRGNPEEIKKEIRRLRTECEEEDILLKQSIKNVHSKAVSALSEAQLSYDKKEMEIVDKILSEFISGNDSFLEEKAEAAMVYAEFSIDFAIRASKNALRAALSAIAQEIECEG